MLAVTELVGLSLNIEKFAKRPNSYGGVGVNKTFRDSLNKLKPASGKVRTITARIAPRLNRGQSCDVIYEETVSRKSERERAGNRIFGSE